MIIGLGHTWYYCSIKELKELGLIDADGGLLHVNDLKNHRGYF